jgi:hypothetical protein
MKQAVITMILAVFLATALCSIVWLLFDVSYVIATPGGATISSASTAGTPSPTPGNRSDTRGTITTIILSATTQDSRWKAYVGNISGKLSLDDATGNTIYDWPLSVGKTGEVYITRALSPTWGGIACINSSNLISEGARFFMSGADNDNINRTFNYSLHQSVVIGAVTIATNTCNSTATYINDSRQNMSASVYFQELLLQDNVSNVIYTTLINASMTGFDTNQWDFQAIVPENNTGVATTYYFFTELG